MSFFGIDFGTTNSAVVQYFSNSEPIFYGDGKANTPMPSIVAINKSTGEIHTGIEAKNHAEELKKTCKYFYSIKREMDKDEVFYVAGKEWTAVDIASEIFKSLRDRVKKRSDNLEDLTEAVVAIPVGFSSKARQKIRKAAEKAGINIKCFISEPTAAFFANYENLKHSNKIAVFDWGGGTLDVCVIEHNDGKITELTSDSIWLAGDNIDEKLSKKIHATIASDEHEIIEYSEIEPSGRDSLRRRSEDAKIKLSSGKNEEISIPISAYGPFEPRVMNLSSNLFDNLIETIIDDAVDCFEDNIKRSKTSVAEIDSILMVGGSSNLKAINQVFNNNYEGTKIYKPKDSMWNVALGAAKSAMLPGKYYSSQSVGLKMSDDGYFELLSKGDCLKDYRKKCSFGIVDTSNEARFVFSGSKDIDESPNRYKVLDIPAYKFLEEMLELNVEVDNNQIFRVTITSNMNPRVHCVWEYEKLKYYYNLPSRGFYYGNR